MTLILFVAALVGMFIILTAPLRQTARTSAGGVRRVSPRPTEFDR